MAIELRACNFGLKSYLRFQNRTSAQNTTRTTKDNKITRLIGNQIDRMTSDFKMDVINLLINVTDV